MPPDMRHDKGVPRMRKRVLAAVVAGSTALMLAPAASQADEVDTQCKNGSNPVHYSLTDASLIKAEVRVLCVRD